MIVIARLPDRTRSLQRSAEELPAATFEAFQYLIERALLAKLEQPVLMIRHQYPDERGNPSGVIQDAHLANDQARARRVREQRLAIVRAGGDVRRLNGRGDR